MFSRAVSELINSWRSAFDIDEVTGGVENGVVVAIGPTPGMYGTPYPPPTFTTTDAGADVVALFAATETVAWAVEVPLLFTAVKV
jgi:hypothetical protein